MLSDEPGKHGRAVADFFALRQLNPGAGDDSLQAATEVALQTVVMENDRLIGHPVADHFITFR